MSKDRIEYKTASFVLRLVALIIDLLVGVIIAFIGYLGIVLEYELIWKNLGLFDETAFLPITIVWGIIGFGLYYVLASSFTDGQTVGKILIGIRVVTDNNESTKRGFRLHLKRLLFIRGGTKVVKEKDPEVKGL